MREARLRASAASVANRLFGPRTARGGTRSSPARSPAEASFASLFVTAPDGLRLHLRSYGPRSGALAVFCLPGFARTAGDFHDLAVALAGQAREPRRVWVMESRGRGQSEFDPNPKNYSVEVELEDLASTLSALEVAPAVFIGSGRGGLLAMLLAVSRPTVVAGLVLNDFGPVVEARGLMRIRRAIGQLPVPRSFEEGADILRRLNSGRFSRLSGDEWLRQARLEWKIEGRRLLPNYDPNLTRSLEHLERPIEPLWRAFDALAQVPLMVIRGGNSDVLSSTTVEAMLRRRAELEVAVVAEQGHVPLLNEARLMRRIAAFVATCEARCGAQKREWAPASGRPAVPKPRSHVELV